MKGKIIQKVIDLFFIQKISVGKIIQKVGVLIFIQKSGKGILIQKSGVAYSPCKFIPKIDVTTHNPKNRCCNT